MHFTNNFGRSLNIIDNIRIPIEMIKIRNTGYIQDVAADPYPYPTFEKKSDPIEK